MADGTYPETYHRWEWFRRAQWWPGYLERMRAMRGRECGILLAALDAPSGSCVLDATCGLGRKTLLLDSLGLSVVGADACAYAVERARNLAAGEGRDNAFFVSSWRDLPARAPGPFDGVLIDAFPDCCETGDDLAAALSGIAGVLKPGGVFVFPGPEPGETPAGITKMAWESGPRFQLCWEHAEGGIECTCLQARTLGDNWIDEHALYVVREAGAPARLESATIRRHFRWTRAAIEEAARAAAFSSVAARTVEGCGHNGAPLVRIVATR